MNNKSKKPLIVTIVLIIAVIAFAGYGVYAYSKDLWPFSAQSTSTDAKAAVAITKLKAEKNVLTVGVKVTNGEENGYCVLTFTGKRAGLKIDDSETKKNSKADVPFEACKGWSVGVKNLPAGEYTAEVKYVGPNATVTATDKVTLK